MHPQEFAATHHYCSVVYKQWHASELGCPEVNNDLFSFVNVPDEVILAAPDHKLLHLLFVGLVLVVLDEAHYRSVIHILNDVLCSEPGSTVMGHQGEQQRAQDTALRGTSAQGDDGRFVIPHMPELWLIREEVKDQLNKVVLKPRGGSLFTRS